MADLFSLSAAVIDSGDAGRVEGPLNRITQELSELGDGLAMVESFSHSILFTTEEGLVIFDTSGAATGRAVVESIRNWSREPFHTLVYTHGHVDHVGGSGAFLADARDRQGGRPRFVGHEKVLDRMRRYRATDGYNMIINRRQFQGFGGMGYGIGQQSADGEEASGKKQYFLPPNAVEPDTTYARHASFRVGDLQVELHHALGETDDHSWAWIPRHAAVCAGDFFIWNFPNCGNPQKVQRYPLEWARALRDIMARRPELLLPAHGLPIQGEKRVQTVLNDVATVLENLVRDCLEMMNAGAALNDLLHGVRVPAEQLEKPWLRPLYDEPEFAVRNIWRLYGGWYDGDPSQLKPAQADRLAAEMAGLAGGADKLAARAAELADGGDFRLACHLAETAARAAPDSAEVHRIRSDVYQRRREQETSLMAKGIFGGAANESRHRLEELGEG